MSRMTRVTYDMSATPLLSPIIPQSVEGQLEAGRLEVVIVGETMFANCVETLAKFEWLAVVFDEVHSFKNPATIKCVRWPPSLGRAVIYGLLLLFLLLLLLFRCCSCSLVFVLFCFVFVLVVIVACRVAVLVPYLVLDVSSSS